MKRLIEMDFPIFEVSRESAREKSIRHGHISTLHIWWARRPLAACRAAVFASLVPTPAGMTERIPEYVEFLLSTLPPAPDEKPREWDGIKAHKRLVKFTADLSPWEATQNKQLIDRARKIILVAKAVIDGLRGEALQEVIDGKRKIDPPKVLDPFAGGGSIPLEALRLGCEAYAVDYNPVAVLILKATLEYPQKYGKRLVEDVKKWGDWVLEELRKEVGRFYPEEGDPGQGRLVAGAKKGGWAPVGYIWAHTIVCQNPSCGAEIPLMRQFWLRRKERDGRIDWEDSIYLHPIVDKKKRTVEFEVVERRRIEDFDPSKGTRPTTKARATFLCPVCGATYKAKDLRKYGKNKGLGHRMICVVLHNENHPGKKYRAATSEDTALYEEAARALEEKVSNWDGEYPAIPDEPLPQDGTLGFSVNKYGYNTWGDLFNARQLLALIAIVKKLREAVANIAKHASRDSFAGAVATGLAFCADRIADYNSRCCMWAAPGEFVAHTFSRQALPMVWDYFELNPVSSTTGGWVSAQDWVRRALEHCARVSSCGLVKQGSATGRPWPGNEYHGIVTDPPYYDNVPYSDVSDFFYVWLKRLLSDVDEELFATPLTPKSQEIIQEPVRHERDNNRAKRFYEEMMGRAFSEMAKALESHGISTIIFAHKTTEAWETLVSALLQAGLVPTSSWPIHTERGARLRARESAALASSFFLACRKRESEQEVYFKDIREALHKRIHERLEHFWEQGIRGADFFISAIGPAVEVFGKYAKVKKVTGEEVTVAELLHEVRKEVTDYALRRILGGIQLDKIDAITRFYILWRWTYNGETVEYDDGRKLAQAVGIELDDIRGREKLVTGKDKIAVAKPQERDVDSIATRAPVNLVDALHKACLLWNADRTKELQDFLAETGYGTDSSFWETAQALSELLPDGDKEKQMLQGLLMKAPTVAGQAEKQLTLNGGWTS